MALVDAVSVIESLEALEPHYLPWLDRRGALAALKEGTLPRPNSESWKYTDPAPFFDPELFLKIRISTLIYPYCTTFFTIRFCRNKIKTLTQDRLPELTNFQLYALRYTLLMRQRNQ